MSEEQVQQATLTPEQTLQNIEQVRDLFARAHDYIGQATYPGHMGMKVVEVMNFLKFQYDDFKQRADNMAKQIEVTKKAAQSVVDVPAAKAAVEASLSDEHGSAVK